jgi:hypothetical protein
MALIGDVPPDARRPRDLNAIMGVLRGVPHGWTAALQLQSTVTFGIAPAGGAAGVGGLLRVLGDHGRWAEAARLFASSDGWRSGGGASPKAAVTVLTNGCYALRGNWHCALTVASTVVRQLPPRSMDAAALGAVAKCCLRGNRWEDAAALVALCERDGVVLSATLRTSIVVVFNKAQQPALAKRLLRTLVNAAEDPALVGRALNSMVRHARTPTAVAQWAAMLRDRGLPLDDAAHARLVEADAEAGRWESALRLLDGLVAAGHTPSGTTHDYVQYGLGLARVDWRLSLAVFSRMETLGVEMTDMSFKAVVAQCMRQGAAAQSQAVLRHMIRRGVGGSK